MSDLTSGGPPADAPEAHERIASGFCLCVAGVIFAALALGTVYRDFRILLRADGSSSFYPSPIYGILPLPAADSADKRAPVAGADFSQVYTSALALRHGESAYSPKSAAFRDRFGRKPGLPPLTNWLYVPLSLLPYGAALMTHTVLSICLLLGIAFFDLGQAGLGRPRASVCVAILSRYVLTPIVLTHLERGQFDLFVAAAVLACVSCLLLPGGHPGLAVAAGFLGAMKWTAPSFLLCFCAAGFVSADRQKRRDFFVVSAVMLLTTLAFGPALKEYWPTIQSFEINAKPSGLTLQNFLPRWAARSVLPTVTLAAAALVRIAGRSTAGRVRLFESIGVPFALALACFSICFGTLSYEYHTVILLGLIPAVVVWTSREPGVSRRWRVFTCGVFGVFLCIAFRTVTLSVFSPVVMTAVYVAAALLFLSVCVAITMQTLQASDDGTGESGQAPSESAVPSPRRRTKRARRRRR
jgi:hypothetical protein